MARPRVILACNEAEVAVRMIAALNPKRYRVEHIFDLSEALLRANIVLAHALVIHPESYSEEQLEICDEVLERVSPIVVSREPARRELALRIGARFLSEPFEVPTFKRAVYRAVSKTQDRRQSLRHDSPPTGIRRLGKVLVLHRDPTVGAVMAAVLRNQLGVVTEAVRHVGEANDHLDDSVDCIVVSPELLMASAEGAELGRRMAQQGVPIVPLDERQAADVSEAGQLAWDLSPRVRRSITARDHLRDAG